MKIKDKVITAMGFEATVVTVDRHKPDIVEIESAQGRKWVAASTLKIDDSETARVTRD